MRFFSYRMGYTHNCPPPAPLSCSASSQTPLEPIPAMFSQPLRSLGAPRLPPPLLSWGAYLIFPAPPKYPCPFCSTNACSATSIVRSGLSSCPTRQRRAAGSSRTNRPLHGRRFCRRIYSRVRLGDRLEHQFPATRPGKNRQRHPEFLPRSFARGVPRRHHGLSVQYRAGSQPPLRRPGSFVRRLHRHPEDPGGGTNHADCSDLCSV